MAVKVTHFSQTFLKSNSVNAKQNFWKKKKINAAGKITLLSRSLDRGYVKTDDWSQIALKWFRHLHTFCVITDLWLPHYIFFSAKWLLLRSVSNSQWGKTLFIPEGPLRFHLLQSVHSVNGAHLLQPIRQKNNIHTVNFDCIFPVYHDQRTNLISKVFFSIETFHMRIETPTKLMLCLTDQKLQSLISCLVFCLLKCRRERESVPQMTFMDQQETNNMVVCRIIHVGGSWRMNRNLDHLRSILMPTRAP